MQGVIDSLMTSSMRMKRQYDVDSSTNILEVGDPVWLYSLYKKMGLTTKLMRPWTGPYVVTKRLNDLVLTAQSKPKTVHRNRLWKYSGQMSAEEENVLRRSTRVRREPHRLTY